EPALEKLRGLHPQTKVKLLDLFPAEQIAALREGKIDLALTEDGGNLPSRDFHVRKLAVTGSCASLPQDHPLASRRQIKVADLKGETFIVASDAEVPGSRSRLLRLCRRCGGFRPKMMEVPGGLPEAFSAIANDGAVALLPAFLRHQKRPGMVILPVSDAAATWDLAVVWPQGQKAKPLRTLLASLPFPE
ncbi:MAG TPA: LysR family substrate-binding domain-containing protein, partial [Verrucomicrobiales bacterium]|nr:LysR family substrate-binding domain-containing protein [Verrucomicrobiales bacterium]